MMFRVICTLFACLFAVTSPAVYSADDPKVHLGLCRDHVPALLLLKPDSLNAIRSIESTGVIINGAAGDVLSVRVPACSQHTLSRNPNIRAISGLKSFRILLDQSGPDVGVTYVRERLPNGGFVGSTGEGVVIGIVDSGIDWRHPDFRNPDGTTRIARFWDPSDPSHQVSGGVIGSAPPAGLTGTVYRSRDINVALQGQGLVNSSDGCGHGTHVAGIAAGNGAASTRTYPAGTFVGVAPEADLVVVRVFDDECVYLIDDIDLVQAMAFIDRTAAELGRPYVISMSLGTQIGAHDGTELEELAIDTLAGPGKPGKAIVVSAGNDGAEPVHVSGNFGNPGSSDHEITITVEQSNAFQAAFSFWFDGRDDFRVVLEGGGLPSQDLTPLVRLSPLTGSKQLLFVSDRTPAFTLRIVGKEVRNGRFDGWLEGNARFVSHVDRTGLVSIPATSRQAITVGAYTTKVQWVDDFGRAWVLRDAELYRAARFTSPGPTRDGRLKPELAAPGQVIASSLSSNAGFGLFPDTFVLPGRKQAVLQGTSMSAPQVAGATALLFGAIPGLDSALAREFVSGSARADEFTGTVPNLIFGAGKLDIASVLAPSAPRVALSLDQPVRLAREVVSLWFGLHQGAAANRVDAWIALVGPDGMFRFLDPATEQFDYFPTPYRTDLEVTNNAGLLFRGSLPRDLLAGDHRFYAVGVAPGMAPFDSSNWMTNLAVTTLKVVE